MTEITVDTDKMDGVVEQITEVGYNQKVLLAAEEEAKEVSDEATTTFVYWRESSHTVQKKH